MIAIITKITKKPSNYGGHFFQVSFKGTDNKNYYTYIYPRMRNYQRWKKVLKKGVTLKRLKIFKKNLIDADSNFQEIGVK